MIRVITKLSSTRTFTLSGRVSASNAEILQDLTILDFRSIIPDFRCYFNVNTPIFEVKMLENQAFTPAMQVGKLSYKYLGKKIGVGKAGYLLNAYESGKLVVKKCLKMISKEILIHCGNVQIKHIEMCIHLCGCGVEENLGWKFKRSTYESSVFRY